MIYPRANGWNYLEDLELIMISWGPIQARFISWRSSVRIKIMYEPEIWNKLSEMNQGLNISVISDQPSEYELK